MISTAFIDQLKYVIVKTRSLLKGFDFKYGDYASVFRQINPSVNGIQLYNIDGQYVTWNLDDYDVNNYRILLSKALSNSFIVQEKIKDLQSLGRILLFEFGFSTHDGIALVDSQNFLDESDAPPIDTWFFLGDNFLEINRAVLFCWIPFEFVEVVNEAGKFSFMQCYHWLDELSPDTFDQISDLVSK